MGKRERGIVEEKEVKRSRNRILEVLKDGEWLRYKEIVNKTGLSQVTVSKYLKILEKEGKIEKKIDIESGEYPYPVYYRISGKGVDEYKKVDAVQFLEKMNNPIVIDIPNFDGKLLLRFMMSVFPNEDREKIKKEKAEEIRKYWGTISKILGMFFEFFDRPTSIMYLWDPKGRFKEEN
ncbi:winged helix-turn-helix transcriptional regulator [Candidatus Bathyarchaeota archaeon]|nr:winged helix-turn-helix transcriptional regulator [Candidatus Bathyarchaeota archaeon]